MKYLIGFLSILLFPCLVLSQPELEVEGDAVIDGTVGIGINAPATFVHIKTQQFGNGILRLESTSSNCWHSFYNDGGYTGYVGILASRADDFELGSAAGGGGKVHLSPRAIPGLTVIPGGDVGIGTTSPSTDLELSSNGTTTGRLTSTSNDNSDNAVLQFYFDGGTSFEFRDWELRPDEGDFECYVSNNNLSSQQLAWELDYDGLQSNRSFNVDGHVRPLTNNVHDLGSSARRWDDVYATNGTINTSDERAKQNIQDLSYGMDAIMKLRPVSFQWRHREVPETKLGLIAQEVQSIIPEVIKQPELPQLKEDGSLTETSDLLGMYYADLIPVLIKGMQEQEQTIQNQQEQIRMLTERISRLEANMSN